MHYVAEGGCVLGSLCPYRHAGSHGASLTSSLGDMLASRDASFTVSDGHLDHPDSNPVLRPRMESKAVSPLYAQPLCSKAPGLTLWFFAELPALSNAGSPPRWTAFESEWSACLESKYAEALSTHKHHRHMQPFQRGEYTVHLGRMYMNRTVDDGSRRPIQRAIVTASPTWILEELREGAPSASPTKPPDVDVLEDCQSEVIDPVAASCMEFHYVHGNRDLLTIAVNRWRLRINLLTMTAREVREKRLSLTGNHHGKHRFRAAAGVVVTGSRMGGGAQRVADEAPPLGNYDFGKMPLPLHATHAVSPPTPSSPATPRPQSVAIFDLPPAKRFRLRRLPITVRLGCPPSDPFGTAALQSRLSVVSSSTGKSIQTIVGTRPVGHIGTSSQFVLPVELDLGELTAANIPHDPCEAGAQCHWESGHHVWTNTHRCPAGKASQCFLCEWGGTLSAAHHPGRDEPNPSLSSYPPPPEARSSSIWGLDIIEERSEVHRQLLSHEALPVGSAFEAGRLGANSSKAQAAAGPWRRHQAVSRWFRSEWDGAQRSFSISSTTTFVPQQSFSGLGSTVAVSSPGFGSRQGKCSDIVVDLHYVRAVPTSHEVLQLLALMQRAGAVPTVASRRRTTVLSDEGGSVTNASSAQSLGQSLTSSAVGTPAALPSTPTNSPQRMETEALLHDNMQQLERQHAALLEQCEVVESIKAILRAQLGENGAPVYLKGDRKDVEDADLGVALSGLQIQRVQHHAFYSRYLRTRSELFVEWHAMDSESADHSREETLYRYIPRSWLRSILYLETAPSMQQKRDLRDGDDHSSLYSWDQRRMHFYRDVTAASGEPRIAGVPYVLLIVVAFAGAAVRLTNAEALQLAAAPLAVPWHVNSADDDDHVRRYQSYHAVVCDDSATDESASGGVGRLAAVTPPTSQSPSRSPRSGAREHITSPRSTNSSSMSATAKKVFLYDPAQWCPMYLLFM